LNYAPQARQTCIGLFDFIQFLSLDWSKAGTLERMPPACCTEVLVRVIQNATEFSGIAVAGLLELAYRYRESSRPKPERLKRRLFAQ
jgi:hypothetical protein